MPKFIIITLTIITIAAIGTLFLAYFGESLISEVTLEILPEDRETKISGIKTGEKAPYFELKDLDENSVAITGFLGKPFILTFWTTWNTLSADQIKIFDDYLVERKKDGNGIEALFGIITINNQEDKSIVSNFMKRGGYQVKVLLDEDGSTGEIYQARNLPVTYFMDADGIVRDINAGILSEEMLLQKIEKIIYDIK
jgi:peroxiredoxin